jgi:hypothetical protein
VSAVLAEEQAADLVERIRVSFGAATRFFDLGCKLLVEAYQGRAWEALGLADWSAFVHHTFDVDRLRLTGSDRAEIVAALRDGGLSMRAVATATGLGLGTVHRELATSVPNGTDDEAEGSDRAERLVEVVPTRRRRPGGSSNPAQLGLPEDEVVDSYPPPRKSGPRNRTVAIVDATELHELAGESSDSGLFVSARLEGRTVERADREQLLSEVALVIKVWTAVLDLLRDVPDAGQ